MSPLDYAILSLLLLALAVMLVRWVHQRPGYKGNSVYPLHLRACDLCGRSVGHTRTCPTQDRPTGESL